MLQVTYSECVQTITVQDVTKPVITCPGDKTLNCQDNTGITSNGVAIASDNCGPVSITHSDASTQNSNPNNAGYYNYVITRTWRATDVSGNFSECVQAITVRDITKPVITCPANVTVNCQDNNTSSATGVATGTDNCSPVTITQSQTSTKSNDVNSPAYYNYVITRTWTATDVTGNFSTCVQTITVRDVTAPVITYCPVVVTTCNNLAGNNKTMTLTATDNCNSPIAITWSATGATSFSGSGGTVTANFNVGTTTISWTVKDVTGNTSTCATTVVVNPLPSASYVSTGADEFCNQVTLTGASTINAAEYSWTSTNAPGAFSNSPSLSLGLSNADGNYYLYVKVTATGCVSATAASYNFQKQNLSSSYTIIAMEEVKMGYDNVVQTGSIGVMGAKGKVDLKKRTTVTGPGSFVKAVNIDLDKDAVVTQPIYAAATPVLPTMFYNTVDTKNLPNVEVKDGLTATLSGNYGNVKIKKGAQVTLKGTTFGNIQADEGAQLTFTQPNLSIDELKMDKGPKNGGYSYVRFAPNSKVLVGKKVEIGDQVYLNPDNNKVTFYVGRYDDKKDEPGDDAKFKVNGKDVVVTVNVVMPNGKLYVNGGDANDNAKYPFTYIRMTGLFVANKVNAEAKNVIWNGFACGAPPAPVIVSTNTQPTQSITAETKVAEVKSTEEELKVTVMPNPTTTYFTLKLESKYETPVNMRVMDASGRVVDARSKIGSNSTIQIGHNYSSGTYYAEMIQGTKRKVVQLIKGRG